MSKLGIFVNRQTLSSSEQITAVIKCRDVAESMGYAVEFIFPVDMKKIPRLDALFIRANTDPMNSTYVAARIAQMYGITVMNDPESIKICADKINMYMHLIKNSISMPQTRFLNKKELDEAQAAVLFLELGSPLVLKEPSTSFSARVEKVEAWRICSRWPEGSSSSRTGLWCRSISRAGRLEGGGGPADSCSTPAAT